MTRVVYIKLVMRMATMAPTLAFDTIVAILVGHGTRGQMVAIVRTCKR